MRTFAYPAVENLNLVSAIRNARLLGFFYPARRSSLTIWFAVTPR